MAEVKTEIEIPEELGYIESLVEDSNRLLDSIYTVLASPPKRRATQMPTLRASSIGLNTRNNNSNESRPKRRVSLCESRSRNNRINESLQIPSQSPELNALATTSFSPSALDIEREVSRISNFCDKIEQNLNGVADTSPRSSRAARSRKRAAERVVDNKQEEAAAVLIHNEANENDIPNAELLRSPTRSRQATPILVPEAFIDLSDTACFSPVHSPRQNQQTIQRIFNADDDAVIIITPHVESSDDIVDLCTPILQRVIPRRNALNHSDEQRNNTRRRLLGNQGGSASTDRQHQRRSSIRRAPRHNDSTSPGNAVQADLNVSTGMNCSERTPFMCAVCMESCIKREPTSTTCGHVFCKQCIQKAVRLTHKCPMCNTKLTPSKLFRIYV